MKIKQLTTLKHKLQWLLLLAALLGVSQGVLADDPCQIRGSWDSWTDHNFSNCSDASIDITFDNTGTYDFGFDNEYNQWHFYNGTITRSDCTDKLFSTSGSVNAKITVDVAGTYTFRSQWKNSGRYISVTYPCEGPTVTASGASNIRPTTATISGTYSGGSGIGSPTFTVSGGTLGSVSCSSGTCSASVTGLSAGSSYSYTFDVPNDCGTTKSSSQSFSTCYKYFDGNTYLYIDVSAVSWFTDASAVPNMNFDGGSWGDASLVTGKIYRIKPTAGCYSTFGIRRHGSDYWNTCSNNSFSGIGANNELVLSSNWSDSGCSNFTWSSYNPCTPPTASGFTMSPTSVTYDGSPHAVTVTPKDGYGAVSDIKYNGSSTAPTDVNDYTVTADIAAEGDWCAVNDLVIGTFSIIKRNQSALSITTSTGDRCTGTLPLQLAVSGGSTSGTVTYAETAHTGTVSVTSSGSITASTDASITVTATMAGDATYNDVVSSPVTFTFTESPVIYLTGTGANGASATYPWEYMTITVDRGTGKTSPSDLDVTFTEEPSFSSGTAPAHSVTITGEEGDKTYKLKSAKTVNDAHYYTVKANGSNGSCAAAETSYNVYIDSAPAEVCE